MSSGAFTSRKSIRLSQTVPSGPIISKRHRPPVRTSPSFDTMVKPFGPNHWRRCSTRVHASKTSARGASNTRERTISRSSDHDTSFFTTMALLLFLFLFLLFFWLLFRLFSLQAVLALKLLQIRVELREAVFPDLLRAPRPRGDEIERIGADLAWAALRIAPLRDEARALEHLQMP